MKRKEPSYRQPVSYTRVSMYFTPEQHEKLRYLAQTESERLSKETGRTIRISMADYLRTLVDRCSKTGHPAAHTTPMPAHAIMPPTPETPEEARETLDKLKFTLPAPTPVVRKREGKS